MLRLRKIEFVLDFGEQFQPVAGSLHGRPVRSCFRFYLCHFGECGKIIKIDGYFFTF